MNESTSIATKNETPGSAGRGAIPVPRLSVSIRQGALADLPFIDRLQKLHSAQVGFMPRVQLEQYIEGGCVLVAEGGEGGRPVRADGTSALPDRLGYVIAKDRYFRRDDCGIIFQLNVAPGSQRHLIGATLIREVFQRAAYGCRLYSCWCAQDIAANRFWEAMGFVPLAFRTGSREGRSRRDQPRIHIFWQRRVREGDAGSGGGSGGTPYWYPCQTNAGAIREDRLVFPIPEGVRWDEAMPVILPSDARQLARAGAERVVKSLPAPPAPQAKNPQPPKPVRPPGRPAGGMWYGPPAAGSAAAGTLVEQRSEMVKKERVSRPRQKHDPKHVAMARELRDRYLEAVNAGKIPLPEPDPDAAKYDVSRRVEDSGPGVPPVPPVRTLIVGEAPVRRLLEAA